jgi:hypothetical protein
MTQWRVHDFEAVDPADPLLAFLADRPQWTDQVSLIGPTPALTPAAFEASLRWLLHTGRIQYAEGVRRDQALLTDLRQEPRRGLAVLEAG